MLLGDLLVVSSVLTLIVSKGGKKKRLTAFLRDWCCQNRMFSLDKMNLFRGKVFRNSLLESFHKEQEVADSFGLVQGSDKDVG